MQKTFVLDTNVILHSYTALTSFSDNKVVIPFVVIEELDRFKGLSDERGRNARSAIRFLDKLRTKGKLYEGVSIENKGVIKVELDINSKAHAPNGFELKGSDWKILSTCLYLQSKGEKVIFISKDMNARIMADVLKIETQDFEKFKINFEEIYTGWQEMELSSDEISGFYKKKEIKVKAELLPNQFLLMKEKNGSSSAIGRYSAKTKTVVPLRFGDNAIWGVKPLNVGQKFAFELLLDDAVSLVCLIGKAGTGKTLLALAAGLQKVTDDKIYKRIIVSRPIVPLGKDIGYLPGTKEEKLENWMQPIFDNLEFILDRGKENDEKETMKYLLDSKVIELEAITYIRGRSIPRQYMIVDEAQNLTPHEIKTVISRAGTGTKIILTGDPYQIDNPYLDANSNGLSYTIEHFKGQEIFGQIFLEKSERSKLASLAAELL